MTQLSIEAALDRTLARVSDNNLFWMKLARNEAKQICIEKGSVTTDNLREWVDRTGFAPDSQHSFGAVLKCRGFVHIGRERSRYKSNNGRFISRYRWEPA